MKNIVWLSLFCSHAWADNTAPVDYSLKRWVLGVYAACWALAFIPAVLELLKPGRIKRPLLYIALAISLVPVIIAGKFFVEAILQASIGEDYLSLSFGGTGFVSAIIPVILLTRCLRKP